MCKSDGSEPLGQARISRLPSSRIRLRIPTEMVLEKNIIAKANSVMRARSGHLTI